MKYDTKIIFVITGAAVMLYLLKTVKSSLQDTGLVNAPDNYLGANHGPQISPTYTSNPIIRYRRFDYQNYTPRQHTGTPFSNFSFGAEYATPSYIDYGRRQTVPTRKSTHTPFTAAQAAAFAAQERSFGIPVIAIGTSVMPANSVR